MVKLNYKNNYSGVIKMKIKKSDILALPTNLNLCHNEEEVKYEFAKAFQIKIDSQMKMDLYLPTCLFEFKYDKNLKSIIQRARVIAQALYYIRELKYGNEQLRVPPNICAIDKNEAFFVKTKDFSSIFTSKIQKYDWDRAPSTPCPYIIDAVAKTDVIKNANVYTLTDPDDYKEFTEHIERIISLEIDLFEGLTKKDINEQNFEEVFKVWLRKFKDYIVNGHKSSEYFIADIQSDKTIVSLERGEIVFFLNDGTTVTKSIPMDEYEKFWDIYEKDVDIPTIKAIRQRFDRLTKEDYRRFTGEFYTPIYFAKKAIQYLEKSINSKKWWEKGFRLWDMAAGTGNLEYLLPEEALPYCYISTLLEDDARYCKKIYPEATVFQYDYLNDDVVLKFEKQLNLLEEDIPTKLPKNLLKDLANPNIKWIIFINPPFVTANTAGFKKDITKDTVSETKIRKLMTSENMGEVSRELFSQFLYRISLEFKNKTAYLGLFSKLKYINSNNDQLFRDKVFQYKFERGFLLESKNFSGSKGKFPIAFAVWNLSKIMRLEDQKIVFDIFNTEVQKIGTKKIDSIARNTFLNKWVERKRNNAIMPPFSSALKLGDGNKDIRDRIAPDFLASLASLGNDFQHQNLTYILSGPAASAGGFSIVPDNLEQALIMYTTRRLPKATWLNDRDQFFQPNTNNFNSIFVSDCIVWALFDGSNQTVAIEKVLYKGKSYRIKNHFYPFLLEKVSNWTVSLTSIRNSLNGAKNDRYMAKYLQTLKFSPEAENVLKKAEDIYRLFYQESTYLAWPKFKTTTWDVGWYQIRMSLLDKKIGDTEIEQLSQLHKKLGEKILPNLYKYGFINSLEQFFADEIYIE